MNDTADPATIKELEDTSVGLWNAFLDGTPEATFFHRAEWRTVIEDVLGHRCHFLMAIEGPKVRGILPLVHMRGRVFGNALISNGFLVLGGPVANDAHVRQALDDAAVRLASRLGVDHIEYRMLAPMHGDWQRNDALYAYFRKAIVADPDANLKAIPRKQRAVVRKAIDGGLDVDVGHDVDRFYRAFAESYRNLGTPILPKRYYARILETFGDRCEVVTVSHKGQLLSSVMVFLHRDQVMPYYGGGVPAARGTGANDLMYWVTMARAGERGFRIFDFGRSKRGTGSFEFKRHWGFEPEPMVYEYKLINGKSLPDLNPQNPKFARFIAAWQRLPLWVANRLGPLIARELA